MTSRLFAISDLHISDPVNRAAFERLEAQAEDWLALAGDVGETEDELAFALDVALARFARVFWCPGNHELWTRPRNGGLRGQRKYESLIRVCESRGVHTPESPYISWPGDDCNIIIAPLFLLYDYSFRPSHVSRDTAVDWAAAQGVICMDEVLLQPEPHRHVEAWCRERVSSTAAKLDVAMADPRTRSILVNHFPLRSEHAQLRSMPAFSIWCGTDLTRDWHRRYRASAVVTGHMHVRRRQVIDGCRFEEVSLGYPAQWNQDLGVGAYIRQILPAEMEGVAQELGHA